MTPIRALFFLAAITAACAGRIPAQVEDADSLQTQVALLSSQSLTGIADLIQKIKEFVEKLKARAQELEHDLLDALQATALRIARSINNWVLTKTGYDMKLEEKLKALEQKSEECIDDFKTELKQIASDVANSTETCASAQIDAALDIRNQTVAIVQVLGDVASEVLPKLKECVNPEATADSDDLEGSWSDFWTKAECVANELAVGAKALSTVPTDVAKIVSDIGELNNKESVETLEQCVKGALAGQGKRVQKAVANLAYCVLDPADEQ